MRSIELCAGGGGEAIGLHRAGFEHVALSELDRHACNTLRLNQPDWPVVEGDLRDFDATSFLDQEIDLVSGGVPCQPFSVGGKQLGQHDERDLYPEAIRVVSQCLPKAFMFENVPGLAEPRFDVYRQEVISELEHLGYYVEERVLDSVNFGVPQTRKRYVLVGRRSGPARFPWPNTNTRAPSVGEVLVDLMASNGWLGATAWANRANLPAPSIVGGSTKHGGADLGPTRAKKMWAKMGVDALGVADEPPGPDFPVDSMPKLTNRMVARLQGFPDDWQFSGRKTPAYRQIGNAFPAPVAEALGRAIKEWLKMPSFEDDSVKRHRAEQLHLLAIDDN